MAKYTTEEKLAEAAALFAQAKADGAFGDVGEDGSSPPPGEGDDEVLGGFQSTGWAAPPENLDEVSEEGAGEAPEGEAPETEEEVPDWTRVHEGRTPEEVIAALEDVENARRMRQESQARYTEAKALREDLERKVETLGRLAAARREEDVMGMLRDFARESGYPIEEPQLDPDDPEYTTRRLAYLERRQAEQERRQQERDYQEIHGRVGQALEAHLAKDETIARLPKELRDAVLASAHHQLFPQTADDLQRLPTRTQEVLSPLAKALRDYDSKVVSKYLAGKKAESEGLKVQSRKGPRSSPGKKAPKKAPLPDITKPGGWDELRKRALRMLNEGLDGPS